MDLKNETMNHAEYDRFIDLMTKMYLKYGNQYRLLTMEDVRKLFPAHQCEINKKPPRGA
ncbi:hypothetical protein GSF08_03800 [Clostridiaceae bacterium DONG20-135]|uniref:Uncharacterized protein n=1 Tax=Copranaerobaculum intestinale TaxID=2692629 RepID=A0A6N8U915_9FIRM|nr:hypothetical protein [Copranaerobaculum intestinale]MXQ73059.1 hypothetical protein [Copranaerobaculum intestinale]